MVDYTNPVETTFELQRRSIEQSREAIQQTLAFPTRFGEATIEGLDTQESVQRNVVELQQEAIHSVLDALEATLPGVETSATDVREVVDGQYDVVLDNHAEFFDNLETSIEEGFGAYEELSDETLEALEELIDTLIEVQEELEAQSVEATEQVGDQVDELQTQIEDVKGQIQRVSEDAVDAVDA